MLAARGLLKEVDFLSTVSGGGYTGSFLTSRLGNNEPYADVAGPHGPDPGPIRYLRFHAKYLTAVDLWDSWSMVTATLAGMILNWSAPVLLVVLAALAAHGLAQVGAAGWWKIVFAGSGLLTIAALLLYGILMRKGQGAARFGGDLLGWLAAATVLVGAGWMIAVSYGVIPDWIKSHWLSFGSVAVAGPAVLRFIPVLKTPSVRRITLTALLWIAGLIIPLGSLALFLYSAGWPIRSSALPSSVSSRSHGHRRLCYPEHQSHRAAPAVSRPACRDIHSKGAGRSRDNTAHRDKPGK